MTEAMPFLQKYDITFLRPPTIMPGGFFRSILLYKNSVPSLRRYAHFYAVITGC